MSATPAQETKARRLGRQRTESPDAVAPYTAVSRDVFDAKLAEVASSASAGPFTEEDLPPFHETAYLKYGKRACDIAVGLVALPFVLLLTAAVAPFIHREDKGPVFYNAPRVGKGGHEFTMYKFRSMKVNAPDLTMPDGSTYNGEDDPRMTKIGAFLRKTSLDEFPQFLNVLKGDMSIVGPRPDLKRETELYEGNERDKLLVKPGITGYSAVMVRNSAPWHERLKLDVWYVHHVTFRLDAKVFFQTFAAVFGQKGIYVEEKSDR